MEKQKQEEEEEDGNILGKRKSSPPHQEEENHQQLVHNFLPNSNIHQLQQPPLLGFPNNINNVDLNLSLSSSPSFTLTTTPNTPLLNNPTTTTTTTLVVGSSSHSGGSGSGSGIGRGRGRGRHSVINSSSSSSSSRGRSRAVIKTNNIAPAYPWATEKRATLHTMKYLINNGIKSITGEVQCKKCERSFSMEYDLEEKFQELVRFMMGEDMNQRAPEAWTKPIARFPTCKFCGEENSCRPLIANKKRDINWLFLLLGQLIGCCTLEQLKYFCKYTNNHRTAAKDRLIFLAYYTLCRQLEPTGPFHF